MPVSHHVAGPEHDPEAPPPAENIALAALYQLVAATALVVLASFVKLAGSEATPMQAVLYRSIFSLPPLVWALRRRRVPVLSRRWRLLTLRGLAGTAALFCYFYTIAHIQLANALALQQLAPIFVAFLSVWLLRERPGLLHWGLALVCLAGALLIVRPNRGLVCLPALVGLLSAFFSSLAYVGVRALTTSEPTARIVLWFSTIGALVALPVTLPGWRWPSPRAQLLLGVAGLLASVSQGAMTAAYRRAPAHVAAAFNYANVPMAYLSGLLLWGEQPDWLAHVGIAMILAAGIALVMILRSRH
jgi:drug/metabolite transporter (DMT)-like permease